MSSGSPPRGGASPEAVQAALRALGNGLRVEPFDVGTSLVSAFLDERHEPMADRPADDEAAQELVRAVHVAVAAFARTNNYGSLSEAHRLLSARLDRLRDAYDATLIRSARLRSLAEVARAIEEIGDDAVVVRDQRAMHDPIAIPDVEVVTWFTYDEEDHDGSAWIAGTAVGRWTGGELLPDEARPGAPVPAAAWLKAAALDSTGVGDHRDDDVLASVEHLRDEAGSARAAIDREIEATRLQVHVMSAVLHRPLLDQGGAIVDALSAQVRVDSEAERRRYRAALLRTSRIFVLGAVASLMGSGSARGVRGAFDALVDEVGVQRPHEAALAYSTHKAVENAMSKLGTSATEFHAKGVTALLEASGIKSGDRQALVEVGGLLVPIA